MVEGRLRGSLEKPKKLENCNSILDVGVLEPLEGDLSGLGWASLALALPTSCATEEVDDHP
jgi:hypothetical protein